MGRLLRLAACAPVFALLVWAQSSRNSPVTPRLGVYLEFERVPAGGQLEVMERAVEDLLKPAGVSVAWRSTGRNSGTEAFSGLAVVRFNGRCDVKSPIPASNFGTLGETTALASTRVSGGRVLPYTEVECDEVRKALAYIRPGTGLAERQEAFGAALGRVVAHELYHILANRVEHAGDGLAQSSELLSDLVSSRNLPFDESATRSIREAFQAQK